MREAGSGHRGERRLIDSARRLSRDLAVFPCRFLDRDPWGGETPMRVNRIPAPNRDVGRGLLYRLRAGRSRE
jgi:hypothetical protein